MPKLSDFRITKRSVDALGTDEDATYRDADLKGFAVRTKPSGTKTYVVIYKNGEGRTRKVALGKHGELTADEARKAAKKLLGLVAAGEDPSEDRHEDRKAMTVEALCADYVAAAQLGIDNPKKAVIRGKGGEPKKASTLREDITRIDRHIVPLLGKRKVRDLRTSDITSFMRSVTIGKTAQDVKTKARGRSRVLGGAGVASRAVGLLGGIMTFAMSEGIIEVNPCRGVKRPKDGEREVRLSPEQYKALGQALAAAEADGEPWQPVAAVRLLALTGCRLNEIAMLKWSEVDLPGHALRLEDSKTRKSVRPLGAAAAAVLAALPGKAGFVFPAARKDSGHYGSVPKAWKRIIAKADTDNGNVLDGLTPHGLRHAFASVGGDLGLTEITISALIGHSSATVTGRYIHHLDSALIATADRVAGRIAAYLGGEADSAAIVPFRRV